MKSFETYNDEEVFLSFCRDNRLGVTTRRGFVLFNEEKNADAAIELLKEAGFNTIKLSPEQNAYPDRDEAFFRIKLN